MASYIFTIYYGDTKQRDYTSRNNDQWFYRERKMRFVHGFRRGWCDWSDWKKETGTITLKNTETLITPVGTAYRTERTAYRIKTNETDND